MPVGEPDELVRSLAGLPVAAILTELTSHRFVGVNEQATEVFGMPAGELIGTDVLTRIDPRDREAARTAYAAMASKAIDGYQVRRRIIKPDGADVSLDIWGRRVEGAEGLYGLWILVHATESAAVAQMLMMGTAAVVLAVTDHDWRIEYMSADAHLLGAQGSELRGFPLLGLVHPAAADEFLAAIARTATDQLAVTVRTQLRVGSEGWADRYCLIVRMCDHQPPRLGVVISAAPTDAEPPRLSSALDENMRQCALEASGAQTLDALPALAHLPHGSELSARQSEVVARLVAGERPAEIARSMFLSPSTVRNHLVAIYRKFGVHSQAELLAALLRAVGQHEP